MSESKTKIKRFQLTKAVFDLSKPVYMQVRVSKCCERLGSVSLVTSVSTLPFPLIKCVSKNVYSIQSCIIMFHTQNDTQYLRQNYTSIRQFSNTKYTCIDYWTPPSWFHVSNRLENRFTIRAAARTRVLIRAIYCLFAVENFHFSFQVAVLCC